jgi:hypothetical protein
MGHPSYSQDVCEIDGSDAELRNQTRAIAPNGVTRIEDVRRDGWKVSG